MPAGTHPARAIPVAGLRDPGAYSLCTGSVGSDISRYGGTTSAIACGAGV